MADPAGYFVSDWTCDGSYNIARYRDKQTDQLNIDAGLRRRAGPHDL